jgi:two-component system, chemotaxis family, chemotaxis protein CheY
MQTNDCRVKAVGPAGAASSGYDNQESSRRRLMARILAVDDSPSMRQTVHQTLQSAGHEVVVAVDGVDGLKKASTGEPVDLVITDVNMPNMDGLTMVKELRRLPQYRDVPLLVLTCESSSEKKEEGRAAGATGWIVKPVEPSRLLATVQKVLV